MATQATGKIIIAVAPVGRNVQPPAINPLTPKQVADEVIRCTQAGASMVHLHVRDARGVQTADIGMYSESLDRIRKASDIVIQGSTGGLTNLTLEQRCAALSDPRTEVASLNMGSVNFGEDVYINRLPDVRYWAKRMRQTKTVPEMEIFDSGMLSAAQALLAEGAIKPSYSICFCLGFRWTHAQAGVLLVVGRERGQPVDAHLRDDVLQREQRDRADDAAPEAAHAAEDHHDQQRAGSGPVSARSG